MTVSSPLPIILISQPGRDLSCIVASQEVIVIVVYKILVVFLFASGYRHTLHSGTFGGVGHVVFGVDGAT